MFKLVKKQRTLERRLLSGSRLFDKVWYLQTYPDVAASGLDPLEHYIRHGAREGRNPSRFFDTNAYLSRRPDVAKSGMNPLKHFLLHGILEIDGDLASYGIIDVDDTQDYPSAEDVAAIESSSYFDRNWYLRRYPQVRSSGVDPALHYLLVGGFEGKSPGPLFNTQQYLAVHPSASLRRIPALLHHLREGGVLDLVPDTSGPAPLPSKGRKAVFVTHSLNIGGAPILLANIARWFQNHTGYDVMIVAMTGGPLASTMEGIAPLLILGQSDIPDRHVNDIKTKIRNFVGDEPAFTFLNSVASGGYCTIDPYTSPTFAYIHEMPEMLDIFKRHLAPIAEVDHIFCGGRTVRQHLLDTGKIAEHKLTTIPAFIDRPRHSALLTATEKATARKRMGLEPKPKLVVACGVAHWRKQPDVFVRMAAEIGLKRGRDARFIWVGAGEDLPALKKLARKLKVSHLIEFVGHRDDFRSFIEAADVFALPSSEDPFPLVCLEAGLVGAPSVVFREATGMTEMVEPEGQPPAGMAVPLGNEGAFFAAVDHLLTDEDARSAMARTARERIEATYLTDEGCASLLQTIRRVAKLKPAVSVVVPSYNCAPYLQQRLESIAEQTFKDREILLLDDASTDNSQEILSEFATKHIDAKTFFAGENGGSVFKAWERGIDIAEGDFIWIAEADDWCEPDFLQKAFSAGSASGVRVVHGRSIPVNANGDIVGDWNDLYLDRIAPGRWTQSFTSPALKEANLTLGRANTIPNASAVLTRRSSALRAIRIAKQFKLAGDWAFYLVAAAGGQIAYCHEAVNYHRRHDSSVTAGIEGKELYFQELNNIGALVDIIFGKNEARRRAFEAHVGQEAKRFGWNMPLPTPKAPEDLPATREPGILYAVGDLSGGGAQMFAARFVNRWTELPASAVLFVVGHEPDNPATVRRVSPEVTIVSQLDIDAAGGLTQFMASWGLDLVISGHWWGDRAIGKMIAEAPKPIPWIIAMHGCYENVLSNPKSFPTMREDFARAERHASHWVWTADKNKAVFEKGHIRPKATSHIVSGFTPLTECRLTREKLGIANDAVVFTLASRAIESKGWNLALAAFRELQETIGAATKIHLLLIGDGPVGDAIRSKPTLRGVHLIGHTERLADYIHISDVCLLPSWFAGESMPLVLIEFLAQGKPAIVSDVGMSPWAIQEGTQGTPAGIVVARDPATGRVQQAALVEAIRRLATDREFLSITAKSAEDAFRKFDMDRMIRAYRDVARDVLDDRR